MFRRRRSIAWMMGYALASVARAPAATAQSTAATPQPVDVALLNDLDGRFVRDDCAATPRRSLGQRVATTLGTTPSRLVVDAGGLLGPSLFSRWLVDRHGDNLAAAVRSLRVSASVMGLRDLSVSRHQLIAAAHILSGAGAPRVLSNLRCAPAAREACAEIQDADDVPRIVETSLGRIGIVSAVYAGALERVTRETAEGLELQSPASALGLAVTRARAAGAQWVLAFYDPERGREVEDAITVARSFRGDATPDAFIVQRIAADLESARVSANGVWMTSAPPASVTVLDLGSRAVSRVDSTAEAPANVEPTHEIERLAQVGGDSLCREYGRALAGGTLASPLPRSDFADIVLDAMRESAGTDIAVINRGAVEASVFPISDGITELSIARALPFEDSVYVASIRGSVLAELMRGARTQELFVRHVDVAGTRVTVNGRPLDSATVYRVATTGFVATSTRYPLLSRQAFSRAASRSLQAVVRDYVARPRPGDLRTWSLDLSQRTRWTFRWSLDAQLTATNISNAAGFTDTQLARAQSFALRGDSEWRADADHPRFAFENSLRVRYGIARTISVTGTDSGLVENADLIAARTLLTGRPYGGLFPRPFHPLPSLNVYIESEFSPLAPTIRPYHHVEIRPTGDVRFQLSERFSANAGVGLDIEALSNTTPVAPVIVLGWVLRPGRIFSIGSRDAEAESVLDVAVRDFLRSAELTGRLSVKVALPLLDWLAVTFQHDVFLRGRSASSGGTEWGVSSDLLVGLRIAVSRSLQGFRY